MYFIKLAEYCNKKSVSYTTGYRWFKDGRINGAYQEESGSILVPIDEEPEIYDKEAINFIFLKKAFDASKNSMSIGDFAIDIMLNFDLRPKIKKPQLNNQKYFSDVINAIKPDDIKVKTIKTKNELSKIKTNEEDDNIILKDEVCIVQENINDLITNITDGYNV